MEVSRTWFIAIAVVIVVILIGSLSVYLLFTTITSTTLGSTNQSSSRQTTLGNVSSTITRTPFTITSTSTTIASFGSENWLTYHNNLARTGVDANEPSAVNVAPSFDWRSATLDGAIYAEPLVYDNMVIAATENNTVYAINATSGNAIWSMSLGQPVPGSSLPCGDINPSGITGTPVIDSATNTLYVVAYLKQKGHVLFALNLDNGNVLFHRNVNPLGVSVSVEQERGALAISQGMIYIPYGGLDGDCGQYHGFVLGVREDDSSATISYQDPTGREGGIWATAGMAIDSSGDIYIATGNSAATTNFDFGDSVIKLSPSLEEVDYFAPTNWASLNSEDLDLGTVAPLLLGNGTIFQIGKEGVGYLLDSSNLGHVGGEEFSSQVCSAYGGLAYSLSLIYVPCADGVIALQVNLSDHTFAQLWKSSSFNAGPPIVSGNVVWSIDVSSGKILALNDNDGSTIFSYNLGSVAHFVTPASGDGRIFVAGDDSIVAITI